MSAGPAAWCGGTPQPCMHMSNMRKASPRRKHQQMLTYRFIMSIDIRSISDRYRATTLDLHVGQKLDPGPLKSNKLFRALLAWSSRPPGRGRLRCIAHTAGARAAAASAGAGTTTVGTPTGHGAGMFRNRKKCAQPSISNQLQETIRCGKRVSRGFGDCATRRTCTQYRMRITTSVPPTHPTSPFHSSCIVA